MRPFAYRRADDVPTAIRLGTGGDEAANRAPAQFVAGGTTILDLMKLGTMQPRTLIDINGLESRHGRIEATSQGLRLGALVRMAQAAQDPMVRRDYRVIAESLAGWKKAGDWSPITAPR